MVFLLNCFVSFISIGIDYYFVRFGFSYVVSGYFLLIPYIFSFLSSIFWFLSKIKRTNAFIWIPLISLIAFIILFFLPNSDSPQTYHYGLGILCLFLIGLASGGYLIYFLPATIVTIKLEYSGTAYGLNNSFCNLNYILIPYLSSLIVKSFSEKAIGYKYVNLFFITLFSICLILATYVRIS
jgi:hypothetical protein